MRDRAATALAPRRADQGEKLAIFQKRVDPMSATMALASAIDGGDQAEIAACAEAVESLSAQQIFGSVGNLGQILSRHLTQERRDLIRRELAAADGPPEVQAAVRDIGESLLLNVNAQAAAAAVARYAKEIIPAGNNLWSGVIFETVAATGRIVRELGVKLKWK
jgi:hypothetical protein